MFAAAFEQVLAEEQSGLTRPEQPLIGTAVVKVVQHMQM